MYYNISAEFAYSLDRRTIAKRAESTVFSSIPDAILVSGQITGQVAKMDEIKEVSKIIPKTPVLANTGVNYNNVEDIRIDLERHSLNFQLSGNFLDVGNFMEILEENSTHLHLQQCFFNLDSIDPKGVVAELQYLTYGGAEE